MSGSGVCSDTPICFSPAGANQWNSPGDLYVTLTDGVYYLHSVSTANTWAGGDNLPATFSNVPIGLCQCTLVVDITNDCLHCTPIHHSPACCDPTSTLHCKGCGDCQDVAPQNMTVSIPAFTLTPGTDCSECSNFAGADYVLSWSDDCTWSRTIPSPTCSADVELVLHFDDPDWSVNLIDMDTSDILVSWSFSGTWNCGDEIEFDVVTWDVSVCDGWASSVTVKCGETSIQSFGSGSGGSGGSGELPWVCARVDCTDISIPNHPGKTYCIQGNFHIGDSIVLDGGPDNLNGANATVVQGLVTLPPHCTDCAAYDVSCFGSGSGIILPMQYDIQGYLGWDDNNNADLDLYCKDLTTGSPAENTVIFYGNLSTPLERMQLVADVHPMCALTPAGDEVIQGINFTDASHYGFYFNQWSNCAVETPPTRQQVIVTNHGPATIKVSDDGGSSWTSVAPSATWTGSGPFVDVGYATGRQDTYSGSMYEVMVERD